MLQRVLIVLAVLIFAVFAFVGYNTYSVHRAEPLPDSAGSVTARPQKTQDSTPFPAAGGTADTTANADTSPLVTSGGAANADGVTSPTTDSIAADPPNGMTFGGSGHYQLYRQGDLTWRLNTDTGQTCVLFATDEEWRKPKVYRDGCRGRS